ncbi:P-loop_containing nucleoside triphosphate hydrolase [Hexamita inflata]|uniref:P-loop containing nucleoside triphosphate hydrolase n=1 Tax=Hexamita inflata TaxID=28002 RepID=A0AA86Q4D3_9EUKA|nr:P-loop containing nucleoside triphosphate hydrolase [Hexamita inflata]
MRGTYIITGAAKTGKSTTAQYIIPSIIQLFIDYIVPQTYDLPNQITSSQTCLTTYIDCQSIENMKLIQDVDQRLLKLLQSIAFNIQGNEYNTNQFVNYIDAFNNLELIIQQKTKYNIIVIDEYQILFYHIENNKQKQQIAQFLKQLAVINDLPCQIIFTGSTTAVCLHCLQFSSKNGQSLFQQCCYINTETNSKIECLKQTYSLLTLDLESLPAFDFCQNTIQQQFDVVNCAFLSICLRSIINQTQKSIKDLQKIFSKTVIELKNRIYNIYEQDLKGVIPFGSQINYNMDQYVIGMEIEPTGLTAYFENKDNVFYIADQIFRCFYIRHYIDSRSNSNNSTIKMCQVLRIYAKIDDNNYNFVDDVNKLWNSYSLNKQQFECQKLTDLLQLNFKELQNGSFVLMKCRNIVSHNEDFIVTFVSILLRQYFGSAIRYYEFIFKLEHICQNKKTKLTHFQHNNQQQNYQFYKLKLAFEAIKLYQSQFGTISEIYVCELLSIAKIQNKYINNDFQSIQLTELFKWNTEDQSLKIINENTKNLVRTQYILYKQMYKTNFVVDLEGCARLIEQELTNDDIKNIIGNDTNTDIGQSFVNNLFAAQKYLK